MIAAAATAAAMTRWLITTTGYGAPDLIRVLNWLEPICQPALASATGSPLVPAMSRSTRGGAGLMAAGPGWDGRGA
jgi:hypothetical protein